MGIDEFQRLDHGIGQFLHFLRVFLDIGRFHIEASGRISAAQRRLGQFHRAHVHHHFGIARFQHARNRRFCGHADLDLILLHCGDKGLASADGHRCHIGNGQAILDFEIHGQEICRRAEPGDAGAFALEIGKGLDFGVLCRDQLDFARCLAELHHRHGELAFGLQIDAMIVEADNALHGTSQHFVFRIYARRFVEQFDVQPFVLEIAELLGELGWQIDMLFHAADHQRDLVQRQRRAGCRDHKSEGSGGQKDFFQHVALLVVSCVFLPAWFAGPAAGSNQRRNVLYAAKLSFTFQSGVKSSATPLMQ